MQTQRAEASGSDAFAQRELTAAERTEPVAEEAGGWALRFDPVVAFLHRAPELEAEVLQISHELGADSWGREIHRTNGNWSLGRVGRNEVGMRLV